MTATQRLARFSTELTADDIPKVVAQAARLHFLDALGCGLAAEAIGVGRYASAAAAHFGSAGLASAIGCPRGLPAPDAALINGTLCHALDFDDTHSAGVVHVSGVLMPATLGVAEEVGASGPGLVAALTAGYEVMIRLGMAAGPAPGMRGLHSTSVFGVFGATAAAASLYGLSLETTTHAFGIAGSMASGILECFADGTDTKRLHAGWAAHSGLYAARLAAAGGAGPATVLEGRHGLFKAMIGSEPELERELADLGSRWETPNIAFKPFPACHYAQAPMDATLELMRERNVTAANAAAITALVPASAIGFVCEPTEVKRRPSHGYEAQYSLPYLVGSVLCRGPVGVSALADDALADAAVLEVARRVSYEIREYDTFPGAYPGGIRIRTDQGETLEVEYDYQRGGPEIPLEEADVRAKFRSNAALLLDDHGVVEIEAAVESWADGGTTEALAMVRAPRGIRSNV
jgi:2-methylcitrate dehydratase PrpD